MKRFRFPALLGLIFALIFLGRVSAQAINSPYRFVDEKQAGGPFAGYIVTTEGAVGLAPKSGPLVGGRYTIRLSGPFVVEAEVGYFNSARPVRDTTVVLEDSSRTQVGETDFSALLANAALRFNFTGPRTWHGLQPFLSFGAGAAVTLNKLGTEDEKVSADSRFDFGTSFAGQFGGGIEWFVSRRFTIRLDARNVLWKIKTPSGFLLGEIGDRTPDQEWVQNGFFSAGFSLHF